VIKVDQSRAVEQHLKNERGIQKNKRPTNSFPSKMSL
jgi:hypothetical protein